MTSELDAPADLRAYAQQRGLRFLGRTVPAGFRAALTEDGDDWYDNIVDGALAGREHGIIAHHAVAVDRSGRGPSSTGQLVGRRRGSSGSFRFRDLFSWLLPYTARTLAGFGTLNPTMRIPSTLAAVRVPETCGTIGRFRVDGHRSAGHFETGSREDLDRWGLRGWKLQSDAPLDAHLIGRLLAPPIDRVIADHAGDRAFHVLVWWGTAIVRCAGYLSDERTLDDLAAAAVVLRDRLAEVCLPLAVPQPFSTSLPPASTDSMARLHELTSTAERWQRWLSGTAERLGLVTEDPTAYHRAFPSIPVPGQAVAVLRGDIPRFGRGRLVVHREQRWVRPAVVVESPRGALQTPPGGLRFPEHQVVVEARDDQLAVWSLASYWGDAMAGDLLEFLARADVASTALRNGS